MNSDDFENQLKQRPLRPPPPKWRAEILAEARQAAQAAAGDREPGDVLISLPWWREWLWPNPQAWAGLAALWLIILAVQNLPQARPVQMSRDNSPGSPISTGTTNSSLLNQRRELARLLEGSAEADTTPKPARPGPRSEAAAPRKA